VLNTRLNTAEHAACKIPYRLLQCSQVERSQRVTEREGTMDNDAISKISPSVDVKRDEGSEKQTWQTIRRKVGEVFSGFLLAFSGLLFFFTFIWVVFAAVVWSAESSTFFRRNIQLDNHAFLEVWGPQIVPGGAEFVEIQFTLRQSGDTIQPASFSMAIPDQFVVLSPGNERISQEVELVFLEGLLEETQTIRLANAHLGRSLNVERLEIKIHQKSSGKVVLGSLSLESEGTYRSALRQYGGGGSEIPFFPLTTLLLSAVAFVYQDRERINRKREEKKKRQEEKQRREQKEAAEATLPSLPPHTHLKRCSQPPALPLRCFIRLWNEITGSAPEVPITIKVVQKAKERVDCA
jgi:hypothetical protein